MFTTTGMVGRSNEEGTSSQTGIRIVGSFPEVICSAALTFLLKNSNSHWQTEFQNSRRNLVRSCSLAKGSSLTPNPRPRCLYDCWDSNMEWKGIFTLFPFQLCYDRRNNWLGPGEIMECASWLCLVLLPVQPEVKLSRKHQNPRMPRGTISRDVRKVIQRFSSLY